MEYKYIYTAYYYRMLKILSFKSLSIVAPSLHAIVISLLYWGFRYYMGRIKYRSIDDINNVKPKRSRLTVLSIEGKNSANHLMVKCLCECGNQIITRAPYFVTGQSISCGCARSDATIKRNTKYIGCNKKIGSAYDRMMKRCYDPENNSYYNYGGRGIIVCEEWKNNKQAFIDWCLNNGFDYGLELDKDIKVPGSNVYSPNTCSWVTRKENQDHKRNTKKYLYNGVEYRMNQLSEMFNIPFYILYQRIVLRGNSTEYAISIGYKKQSS